MKQIHWSKINEVTFTWGIQFLFALYQLFGRWAVLAILYLVIFWYLIFNRAARDASRQYLQHLYQFSNGVTPTPTVRNIFRHFFAFGECILDKLIVWSGNIADLRYSTTGRSIFKEMVLSKQGGVVVVPHIGNLDLCRAIAKDFPTMGLTVLIHTTHATKFNELLKKINPESDIRVVQVSQFSIEDAIAFSQIVEDGGLIAIAGDRIPISGKDILKLNFLGADAAFPIGSYILAKALKCPLISMTAAKKGGEYHIKLHTLCNGTDLAGATATQKIREVAVEFSKRLEQECLDTPFQWFNFYQFWQSKQ